MRRPLLDTHTLLWWLSDDPTLGTEARRLINDRDNHGFTNPANFEARGIPVT